MYTWKKRFCGGGGGAWVACAAGAGLTISRTGGFAMGELAWFDAYISERSVCKPEPSISDFGLDSDGATRLETADGSGLRSGRGGSQQTGVTQTAFFPLDGIHIISISTSDLTRMGLLVWRPLTGRV